MYSDRSPSGLGDKPAGAYPAVQRRRWKLWYRLDDMFKPSRILGVWLRSGRSNAWMRWPVLSKVRVELPLVAGENRIEHGLDLPAGYEFALVDIRRADSGEVIPFALVAGGEDANGVVVTVKEDVKSALVTIIA